MGRFLVFVGLGLVVLGGLVMLVEKIPGFRPGRLPGDIAVERDGFRLYVPITSMILLSGIASLCMWVLSRWRR